MADLTSLYRKKPLRDKLIQNLVDFSLVKLKNLSNEENFMELFDTQGGTQPPKKDFIFSERENYIRFLQIRDFSSENTLTYIPITKKIKLCTKDDVLIGRYGASVGKILTGKEGAYNVACAKIKIINEEKISKRFTFYLMHHSSIQNTLKGITRGAQAGFNKKDLSKINIFLPNYKLQNELIKLYDLYNYKSLNNETISISDFKGHKLIEEIHREYIKNFNISINLDFNIRDLIKSEENVKKLRQSILQDAVQGKLTQEWRLQNPNVTPASELLKTIKAEKEQLIKEKKIKKEKSLLAITKEEIPFEIPESWVWCRMQDLCPNISSGSTPPRSEFKNGGVPYLKVYNIRNQKIDFNYKSQFVNKEYHSTKLKRSILQPGDIIMNIVGPPLGKTAIIPDDFEEWNCNQAIAFFKPIKRESNQWIYTYLLSKDYLKRITLIGTAGQDNISVTKSKNIEIPFPPLEEQKVIVKKVNQLLAYCDTLEQEIKTSKTNAEKLMQSVLSELLGEEN